MKNFYTFLFMFFCALLMHAQYNFPTCSAEWDASKVPYKQGQEVSYNNVNYKCKYYTNDAPGAGSWELIGPCGDGGLGPDYSGKQRIIGYLPTWVADYDIKNKFNPEVVTHLNISFLMFKQNNNDYNSSNFASISFDEFQSRKVDSVLNDLGVLQKAKAKGVKVSVALGGATDYAFLWLMTKYQNNDSKLDEIATLIANYVTQNDLDGVDLDMECWWADPAISGTSDQGGRVRGSKWGDADKGPHPAGIGLTKLSQKLRAKIPNKLITAAVFGTSWYGNNYDDGMADHMDWIGLMSYDFTGSWDKSPEGPHSSLYKVELGTYQGQTADNPIYSAQDALEYWMGFAPPAWNHAGGFNVPKAKLAFGLPVYGYDFSEKKPDGGNGAKFVPYKDIIKDFANAATSYDPKDPKKLRGYIGENGKKIYYNTPKLAAEKIKYSKQYGHQGLIIWELTQDTDYNSSSSILKAVNEAAGNTDPINNSPTVVWEAPTNGQVIELEELSPITLKASATDSDGTIQSFVFKHNTTNISATANGSSYTASFTPAAFGEVTLIASATDNKNAISEKTIVFTVKKKVVGGNTPPSITLIEPKNADVIEQTALSSIQLKATVTDDTQVSSVKFVVNNIEITPTVNGTQYVTDWTPSAFGEVSYKIMGTDNEGLSTEVVVTFTVKEKVVGGSCDGIAEWQSDKVYATAGQKVSYNGNLYTNKWWTKGETPGSSSVWEFVSSCNGGSGGGDFCGSPQWITSIAYNSGDQVYHSQKIYKAKWWTEGETPGSSSVWEFVSDCVQSNPNMSSVAFQTLVDDVIKYQITVSEVSWIKIDVYDIYGKLMHTKSLREYTGSRDFTQDLSTLKSGIYIYKVNIGGEVITKKVIKK
ncbi:glycosyl hydrolase family 18 protein [Aquimarina megaterium]|uniref:glycosyl hydrolase family 18 protein n=1 Tax=Aquimarina megaterium TaxID=1443666 RepID=UPI0009F327E1|nr:glycosyl hydrolase family 18 protein [Aquimarina megaterium]